MHTQNGRISADLKKRSGAVLGLKYFQHVLLDLVTPQTKFGVNLMHAAEVMGSYAHYCPYLLLSPVGKR